ncbi:uncharacterized protein LOC111056222 isoform X2 [Nilaparvata lugens]|nr:uncharacterized protein LOC111056222 isoform X2 [Nilaparvata lugens]XP_039277269.1 uncharacterized protein LOC111056222 isoform X2 [Nilaparvata lugens]
MTSGIEQLPVEVVAEVLGWLSTEDLESASGVSLLWCDIVNDLLLRNKGAAVLRPGTIRTLARLPSSLNRLSIFGFSSFEQVLPVCSEVKELLLGNDEPPDRPFDPGQLSAILKSSRDLTRLVFKHVRVDERIMRTVLHEAADTLKSVTIYSSEAVSEQTRLVFAPCFVEFKHVRKYPNSSAVEMLATYTTSGRIEYQLNVPSYVTKLKVKSRALAASAFGFLKRCPKLQELELTEAFELDDQAIENVVKLRNLRTLQVEGAGKVTAAGWSRVFSCRNLSRLSLSHCLGLTDYAFQQAVAARSRLQLDLEGCKGVTATGLSSLFSITKDLDLSFEYNDDLAEGISNGIKTDFNTPPKKLSITLQRVNDVADLHPQKLDLFNKNISQLCRERLVDFRFQESFITFRLALYCS